MDRGGIEQRHRAIVLGDEKHDLRAAKNDGLGALCDEARDDPAIGRARFGAYVTGNQFVVDDVVNDAPVGSRWNQDIQIEYLSQASFVHPD